MADRGAITVLLVGGGGREHALAWALRRSPSVAALFAAPGNPGIAGLAECVDIPATAVDELTDWAAARQVDLVVVGPELPLALGLADRLLARGVPVFGPTKDAARLEWSKAYAKAFLRDHSIPTADSATFADPVAAVRYAKDRPYPLVVKADGLAAGKGVTICGSFAEAEAAIHAALVDGVFGLAGQRIVVEEYLAGDELSLMALCDGERIACLPPARDYKRLGDGDTGPNTGGMGSIAPVPEVADALVEEIVATVLRPTVDGLRAAGHPYRGVLYAGLMLTAAGPRVLEFNCRFGDPETQAVLPLIDGDLADLLLACAHGRLQPSAVSQGAGFATCLTLATAGYPECPETGAPISGIDAAIHSGALVFHAGTALRDGQLVAAGGRVLSVVGLGSTREQATAGAYAAADGIHFAGKRFRRDIGTPTAETQPRRSRPEGLTAEPPLLSQRERG